MRTARVAVVGSGPAGLYAADALVRNADVMVEVDVLDRLPTPYGLVRYGVAPDHPRIKSIVHALQKVLEHERVRFLGDVELGATITAADLDHVYDAVVYATGASVDRRLDIPGEDLPGSCSATEFVAWYSAHPDSSALFDLAATSVAVIGAGNVALDVARVLAKTVEELAATDMPPEVLERLASSKVRDIHVVCRRGPEHAKFTPRELRELGELAAASVVVDRHDLPEPDPTHPPAVAANLRVFRDLAERPPADTPRRVHFHFWRRPCAITGDAAVSGLELEVTEPGPGDGVVGTGVLESLDVGLVLRSVGYRSVPLADLPFDVSLGRIPNDDGRILDEHGTVIPRRYVTGWVKRGPSGVIGTNRACAAATVATLIAELPAGTDGGPTRSAVDDLLAARGLRPVLYDGWLNIDGGEIERGQSAGRDRTKISDWETLRSLGVHGATVTAGGAPR